MKVAVLSDVHGNRDALEAVIADATAQRATAWWVLGDLVAVGPEPIPTLEVLANLPGVEITRGNTDRYVLTDDRPRPDADEVVADPALLPLYAQVQASFAWTGGAVTACGWRDWMEDLPLEVSMTLPDGTTVLGVHATPGRDDGPGITPDRPAADLQRDLAGCGAAIVIAGHTHRATDRLVGGVRAVNSGSVSNPITDDLRASYVLVHADRHGHHVEHRRVSYDRDAFLAAVARSGHPAAAYIASFQRGEQVRHRPT
jgi:predicted phosphodiesterase